MKFINSQIPASPSEKSGWPWTEETDPGVYEGVKNWPKISIVTATFNQGSFIEETIRSVLLQNYPNLEYIIIDGGSTDNTVEIIKKYEPWISHWESKADEGQSHAINKGLKQCSGDIFNWLNSDDMLAKASLATIGRAFLDENPHVFCGRVSRIDTNGLEVHAGSHTFVGDTPEQTAGFYSIAQPGMYYSLAVLKDFLPVSQGLHYSMDLELWIRYLLRFDRETWRVVAFNEKVAAFRLQEASKTLVESGQENHISGFQIDDCTIFYKLAELIGDEKLMLFLLERTGKIRKNYRLTLAGFESEKDKQRILSVLHFFVLRSAKEAFYKNKINLFKYLMDHVQKDLLSAKGKKDYHYLRRQLLLLQVKRFMSIA